MRRFEDKVTMMYKVLNNNAPAYLQEQFKKLKEGADPGIFERGGPEAIIYKILERGGPKSLKMAFECSFQSLSYKSFANIPQKGGGGGGGRPPPINPPL